MKFFTTVLALATAGNAHMIMKTPIPFNTPDSSPLEATGSNFPCKMTSDQLANFDITQVDAAKVNSMSIGASNTLSFTGSAVHGGGSCQLSIATDSKLSASTKWLTIKSIEGGCPADTTSSGGGNLPADPNGSGAGTFQFTIPDHPDIPTGKAVLAWTWQNRIGNREMYMNCAVVDIAGAAKKRYAPTNFSKRQQAPLPEMFKANIGNGCTTVDSMDVQYPDPGSVLEKGANAKLAAPVGNCGASGSEPVASSAPAGGAVTTSAPASVPTSAASGNISQTAGGGFATVSASGAPSATAPAASQATSVVASTASSASAPIGTGTSGSGATGSCTTGDWNCASDGKSFQRCIAGGTWSASIPMSEGMSCTPGISANFAYAAAGNNGKRDLRSHIARRRHALHGAVIS